MGGVDLDTGPFLSSGLGVRGGRLLGFTIGGTSGNVNDGASLDTGVGLAVFDDAGEVLPKAVKPYLSGLRTGPEDGKGPKLRTDLDEASEEVSAALDGPGTDISDFESNMDGGSGTRDSRARMDADLACCLERLLLNKLRPWSGEGVLSAGTVLKLGTASSEKLGSRVPGGMIILASGEELNAFPGKNEVGAAGGMDCETE